MLEGPAAEACAAYWAGGCLVDENSGLNRPFITHGHPLAAKGVDPMSRCPPACPGR